MGYDILSDDDVYDSVHDISEYSTTEFEEEIHAKKTMKEMVDDLATMWVEKRTDTEFTTATKRMSYLSRLTQSHREVGKAHEAYKDDVFVKIQEEIEELRLEIVGTTDPNRFNQIAI